MEPDYYDLKTHCHVMGATQTGKSSYLFNCIDDLLYQDEGFCLIDWHGTLYHKVLATLARRNYGGPRPARSVEWFANAWGVSVDEMRPVIGNGTRSSPERRIIRFDLSNPEWITPFNPFSL